MRLLARLTSFAGFTAVLLLATAPPSRAAAPQHIEQNLTIGMATVAVPGLLVGLCAYSITNLDSASIYVGFSGSVTNATGIPIATNTTFSLTVTYNNAASGTQVYLYSVAGTSAGAVLWKGAC